MERILLVLSRNIINGTDGWISQIGKTKVFLRAGQMAELDARRAQKLNNAAKTIQRKTRTHIARKHFLALQKAAVCIQSICRGIFHWKNIHF